MQQLWAFQRLLGWSKEQAGIHLHALLSSVGDTTKCMMMCRSKGWVGEDAGCKGTGCCHEVLPEGLWLLGGQHGYTHEVVHVAPFMWNFLLLRYFVQLCLSSFSRVHNNAECDAGRCGHVDAHGLIFT